MKRLLKPLFALLVLALAAWFFRAPLLTGLAEAWVVDEPLTKADAIVVLGGRPELRVPEAARLYHQGIASRILYMDVKLSPSAEMGVVPPEREQTRRLLLSNNVPESALIALGQRVASTYDESQAVLAWVRESGAKSILIPTDIFHTRRVRWLFRKTLSGTGTMVCVRAIEPRKYKVTSWWRDESGLVAFQTELLKLIYYRFKY